MLEQVLSGSSVSISELKKNPSAVIAAAEGFPVAILNHNRPAAYIIPAEAWAALVDKLEDVELAAIVREREAEKPVPVSLDDL